MRAHRSVISHLHKAVCNAKEAGDALRKAKPRVGHGNWLKWLAANFDASAETARAFVKLAFNICLNTTSAKAAANGVRGLLWREPNSPAYGASKRDRRAKRRRDGGVGSGT